VRVTSGNGSEVLLWLILGGWWDDPENSEHYIGHIPLDLLQA
jgi:hypothetical protein